MPKVQAEVGCSEEKVIPYGYCHCGCGHKTPFATMSDNRRDIKKGEPVKYIKGHNRRGYKKEFCVNGHKRTPENLDANGACKLCSREHHKIYNKNNPEKAKLYKKTYREKNLEKIKKRRNPEKAKLYKYIHVKNSSNSYIASLLKIPTNECNPGIIELKRLQIELHRAKKAFLKGETYEPVSRTSSERSQ